MRQCTTSWILKKSGVWFDVADVIVVVVVDDVKEAIEAVRNLPHGARVLTLSQ